MKAIFLLIAALAMCSCAKKYETEYKIELTGNESVDTLIYTDEDGNKIIKTNVSSDFSKTFKTKKGFRSYLYIGGKFNKGGSINFTHIISDRNGTDSYRVNRYYSGTTGESYTSESDHTLK